jgi:hypothetical protein
MTEQKHLKQRVRARMDKTGESYTTARRQVLQQAPPATHPLHFPGSIPVTTAIRVLSAHAGFRDPRTRAPWTEAMLFGIDGGIGAGVFSFHYAKENFSSFYVAGRHAWWEDAGWTAGAWRRLGARPVIRESSGVKPGEKHLRELLAGGRPVIAWVDSTSLPHRMVPGEMSGGGYHVVTVYSIDEGAGSALIGDLADQPIEIPLPALAQARGRIKKFKNRLLALEPGGGAPPVATLVRQSITACVDGLLKCKMKNYTLDAFKGWAEKLDGSKAADSWEKIFAPGPHFSTGLRSINEYIEHTGTGGGLCRPLFAEFLEEAGRALGDRTLGALGTEYAGLGEAWSELARAALPDEVPALATLRRLLEEKYELLHAGRSTEAERAAAQSALQAQIKLVGSRFPLDAAGSTALRRELKRRVLELYEREVAALESLGRWL